MPFVCDTCKAEFPKPAALPRKGFVGRYAPRCPQGHNLMPVNASPAAGLFGFIGTGFLVWWIYVCMFKGMVLMMGDAKMAVIVFAAIYLALFLALFIYQIVLWRKFRSSDFLRRYSIRPAWQVFGAVVGFAAVLFLAHNRYVKSVEATDLILYPQNYVGSDFSVEGTVRNVYTNTQQGYALFDLEGTGVTVQSDDLTKVPKEGDKVHTFGHAGLNRFGHIVLDEYIRWN